MGVVANRALNTYAQLEVETGVSSASPHKLILMLFDGALKAIANAKLFIKDKNIAEKGAAIGKAIAIIDEGLKQSLDVKAGGEIAENLMALYIYMIDRLLLANLKNDIDALDEVSRLLVELRGAWATVGQNQTQKSTASEPTQSRSSLSYGKA